LHALKRKPLYLKKNSLKAPSESIPPSMLLLPIQANKTKSEVVESLLCIDIALMFSRFT